MSKRFPTRELEKREEPQPPMQSQKSPAPRRKAKPSVNGIETVSGRNAETAIPRLANSKPRSQSKKASPKTEEDAQQLPSPKKPEIKTSGSESEEYDLHPGPSKPKPSSTSLEELFGLLL